MKAKTRTARRAVVATLLLVSAAGTASARATEPLPSIPQAVPGQALVHFRPGTDGAARSAVHARAGTTLLRHTPLINYDLVSFPASISLATLQRGYRADPSVASVEPNFTGRIATSPADACTGPCDGQPGQWHFNMTNASFGWDAFPGRTFTASEKLGVDSVTIAVLDTKIDQSHPDFVNGGGTSTDSAAGGQLDLADAKDWIPSSRWTGSAAYHGTFVAGLAGAATGNGMDVAGTGYAARILPLTVVDGGGTTDAAALADAIVYAWRRGARVINLSLGIAGNSSAVHDAIKTATRGTTSLPPSLLVAAAGNNTGSAAFYPGSYPEVLSVTGTDANDRHASCANYNANVSVSAPADRLIGIAPMPGERTQAPCGTSAAAPQVSGLGALLFMQDPARTPQQVRQIIERSADDLGASGRDDQFGWGRINLERALRATGPVTTGARASASRAGGAGAVSATATSARGITAASVIFDRPDAAPVAMNTTDGSFGGTTETLTASIPIPAGTPAGPHPVWVRAFDGTAWGAATVTILAVDGRAPVISGASASNAVRAANRPVTVTFTAIDDYSSTISYGLEFRSTATNAIVFSTSRLNVGSGAQSFSWKPALGAPAGHYRVKIAVADAAGNTSSTEVGTVVA